MQATLLSIDSSRWPQSLEHMRHDIYHLPGYVATAARQEGGEPVAVLVEEEEKALLVPLLLRPVPPSVASAGEAWLDAFSPYGYPAPVMSGSQLAEAAAHSDGRGYTEGGAYSDSDLDFAVRALDSFCSVLGERGVVSAFIRFHPLLEFPVSAWSAAGTLVDHGVTVAIDLSQTADELLMGIKKKHRRFVRKVEALEHRVVITDSPDAVPKFCRIYYENMDRVEASSYYYFPPEYFEGLLTELAGKVHLAFLEIEGRSACADILLEEDGILQAHLGGTANDFLSLSPSIPLTYYECLWAKEREDRYLHLGGGVGGAEDSLFAFKAGFSKLRFPYRTLRLVLDQDRYSLLTGRWERLYGQPADPPTGFFPTYRRSAGS